MYYTLKRVSIHIAHIITITVHNSEQCLPIYTAWCEKAVNKSHAYINQYHILCGVILQSYMQHNYI
jgi:hypothetical protein